MFNRRMFKRLIMCHLRSMLKKDGLGLLSDLLLKKKIQKENMKIEITAKKKKKWKMKRKNVVKKCVENL